MTVHAVMGQKISYYCDEREPFSCLAVLLPFLDLLDRIGCGGAIVADNEHVVEINRTAERIIDEEFAGSAPGRSSPQRRYDSIARLLRPAKNRARLGGTGSVIVQRQSKRPLAVQTFPLSTNQSGDYQMIILVDPNTIPEPGTETLKKMFGLTAAEAKLAVQISRGDTPADIAQANGVTIATVRSQLAAVFAKTETERQAELVSLLTRLAILP